MNTETEPYRCMDVWQKLGWRWPSSSASCSSSATQSPSGLWTDR